MLDVSLTTATVGYGFGKHVFVISPPNLRMLLLLGTASGTPAIMGAAWSKTSFAITMLRVTEGKVKVLIWFIIVTVNLALGGSALIAWIQCTPINKGWDSDVQGTCWDPQVNVNFGIFSGGE
jgi:hypothetical protein